MNALAPRMVACLREVMQNPKPIVQVNAARILARLGEAGRPEAADLMVEIIAQEKYSDAVRVYALRGLGDLFAFDENFDPPVKSKTSAFGKDKAKEAACILALIKFLDRKSPVASDAPKEEIEAVRYVRREAIRALGNTRYPVVMDEKGKTPLKDGDGNFQGPTALVLLRIARNDKAPEPSLSLAERVEAAIGASQMQPGALKEYQPDVTALHVGAVIVDLVNAFNNDVPNKNDDTPAGMPYKFHAARLGQVLADLKGSIGKNPAADKMVTGLIAAAQPMLDNIIKYQKGGLQPNTNTLVTWLQANTPMSLQVYAGVESSVVNPREAGDE
jgi:hypothetical protein